MVGMSLHPSPCAICHEYGNATELYPANFSTEAFTPAIFSARRVPDRIHYRIVRCKTCGLVRSDPVTDASLLTSLYQESKFDYQSELPNLQATYGRYLARLGRHGGARHSILEIGCGNGFALVEALRQGYTALVGVEPSSAAIAAAPSDLPATLICDVMRPGLFESQQFDTVCMFQVIDHLSDPGRVLDECCNVLRPGGLLLSINHNVAAVSARLFKERSPIIDIEHTYLFSQKTMAKIVTDHGFVVKEAGRVLNSYSPRYLWQLLPLPKPVKDLGFRMLRGTLVERCRLSLPLGNQYIIGQRPA